MAGAAQHPRHTRAADGRRWIDTPIFLNAAGSVAEGTYATFPSVPASRLTGKGADWYLQYKQQYRSEPDPYAAYAYEAMNVAIAAIERAGKRDRAAIRDAVFATRNYDGILRNSWVPGPASGHENLVRDSRRRYFRRSRWSFTPTGDTTLTMMAVSQVANRRWDERSVHVVQTLP
jgi:branched-chain amino acid transport system substrate-binding protein